MDASQRSIFGGFFRWLTVGLAAGIGAYLVVNAQRRANSNAHESAPPPEGAVQTSSTPDGAPGQAAAGELTPEQILLFSSKSAPIDPAPGQDAAAPTFLHSSKDPHLSPADVTFVPRSADQLPPFLSSSKTLNPELIRSAPTSPPVVAEDGLLFGSKSGVIRPPDVAPAPFLGSSKRLEPLTSSSTGAKPAQSAPTDAKPKQP
jgi:hypothetical protein